MAITENRLTTSNTRFFKSFVPFQLPVNTIATNNIGDMISINYGRNADASTIRQDIGAESSFVMDLKIKNITTNTELEIDILTDNLFTVSEPKFKLTPGVTRTVFIRSNNDYINEQTDDLIKNTNIKVIVKNITNNLSYIQNNVVRLEQQTLPAEITVT
jgi:hypothetical protein